MATRCGRIAAAIVADDAPINEGTSAAIYWSNVGRHLDVLERLDIEGASSRPTHE
jgi:hypothetical protein